MANPNTRQHTKTKNWLFVLLKLHLCRCRPKLPQGFITTTIILHFPLVSQQQMMLGFNSWQVTIWTSWELTWFLFMKDNFKLYQLCKSWTFFSNFYYSKGYFKQAFTSFFSNKFLVNKKIPSVQYHTVQEFVFLHA